jgi:hypothetical protein
MPLNDEQRRKVIDRCDKLMRFTKENGATPGEIENAAAKLGQLLRENNLALEDISVGSLKTDVGSEFSTLEMGRIQEWQYFLFGKIPETCSCSVIYVDVRAPTPKQPRRCVKKIQMYGTLGDLKMCRYFCDVLCIILPSFAKQYCDGLEYKDRSERASATTSYLKGMIVTINERLAKMVRPPDDAPEVAERGLIIVNNKALAVADRMLIEHPKMKSFASPHTSLDHDHFGMGIERGKDVDLKFGLAETPKDPSLNAPVPNLA